MVDRTLTIALALFALVLVSTDVAAEFAPNTWLFRDGRFYVNVNENLVEHASLEDPFAASWYEGRLGWNHNLTEDWSNRALGARGESYHFRPWLLPVSSTPFFFALGLLGVLLFNCALYGLVAAATYRFVRAYTEALPAALTAVAMVLASGFRHHIYNYSVDMLLVTAFLCGLWGLMEKKGFWSGVLIASAVMIKPTVLLYAPALALVMWERRDGRTLLRAIYGGLATLGVHGIINTYMFGRPWALGYTRVVVVVNGVQSIHSDTRSFETPLSEGALDLFTGPDGVVWWHGLFVLALPGLAVLLRRFPRTGLAVLLSSMGAFALFSKFQWHQDRFLFPTVALLALPLALGMRAMGERFREVIGLFGRGLVLQRSAAMVFVVALTAIAASAFTGGGLLTRHPDEAAIQGAIAIGEGHLDLREGSSDASYFVGETGSTVSLSALGAWAPRGNPLALLPLAPLAHAFGRNGVAIGSALIMASLIAALAWLLRRRLPTPMAAAVALGALLVGPMREAALGRPLETLSALLLIAGLARAVHETRDARGPFLASAALAALAGVVIEQPMLGGLGVAGVVVLARLRDRALVLPTLGVGLAVVGVGLGLSGILWGSPFGSAEDSVLVSADGGIAAMGRVPFTEALALLGRGPSLSRAVVPLFFGMPLAALIALRGDRRMGIGLAVLAGALVLPGIALRQGAITPLVVATLVGAAGLAAFAIAESIAEAIARHGSGRVLTAGSVVLLVTLLGLGLSRRAEARGEAFWIGTPRSVRAATVLLGDAPCDFLAWENMAWECSMLDGGAMGRVGLALPDGLEIAGHAAPGMLLIPTGLRRSDPRVVRWDDVLATERFQLVYGAPEGEFTSDAMVKVRIDGVEVAQFESARSDAGLRDLVIDTTHLAGRRVSVEIELSARARGQQAAIAVAGGFR